MAVPLRKQVILREQLHFPSGTATAELIKMLHAQSDFPRLADASQSLSPRVQAALDRNECLDNVYLPPSEGLSMEETHQLLSPAIPLQQPSHTMQRQTLEQARCSPTATNSHGPDTFMDASGFGCDTASMSATMPVESEEGVVDFSMHASVSHDQQWRLRWRALGASFFAAAVVASLDHWIPVSHALPVASWLALSSATQWGWVLTPSLAVGVLGLVGVTPLH